MRAAGHAGVGGTRRWANGRSRQAAFRLLRQPAHRHVPPGSACPSPRARRPCAEAPCDECLKLLGVLGSPLPLVDAVTLSRPGAAAVLGYSPCHIIVDASTADVIHVHVVIQIN